MWVQKFKKTSCVRKILYLDLTCACENDKYLESIIVDSVIMCEEIIDAIWSDPKILYQ